MIRFGTRILVLVAALSSIACTTIGPAIDNGRVATIEPGVTTQAQIQARFGTQGHCFECDGDVAKRNDVVDQFHTLRGTRFLAEEHHFRGHRLQRVAE